MSTNNQLQKTSSAIEFSNDQIALIRSQIAPKATPDELKLFLYQAQRTGLDPLARQIYAIHRNQKDAQGNWIARMTIQTSIDGFRVIAERSGVYAGQSEPIFDETNGVLKSCKVSVFKFDSKGTRYEAAVGVAYWSEYVQTSQGGAPSGLWAKMPHTMLSKVAEALALRKAFPQDLSGLYTGDEMDQAERAPRTEDATYEVQDTVRIPITSHQQQERIYQGEDPVKSKITPHNTQPQMQVVQPQATNDRKEGHTNHAATQPQQQSPNYENLDL